MDWPNDYGMPTEADEERKLKADLATERAGYDYLKAENEVLHQRASHVSAEATRICKIKDEQTKEIERLEAASAAYRGFLKSELDWEYFRNEMFDDDDPESSSGKNAKKLRDWLEANQQPGERLQTELAALRKIADAAEAGLSEIEKRRCLLDGFSSCVTDCLSQQCVVPPLRSAFLEYKEIQKPPKTQATDNP